jgi:hypothetical protein
MADLVKLPTSNPTRKLSAATLGAAAMSVTGLIIKNVWPQWYDAEVWLNLTPVVIFALGYFTHDEATIVMSDQGK